MGVMRSRRAVWLPVDRDAMLLVGVLAVPIVYAAAVLAIARPSLNGLAAVAGMTPLGTVLGALSIGLFQRAAYARHGLNAPREREAMLVTGAAMAIVTVIAFGIFKQTILPARGFVFDPLLARMGRLMLGGTTPWQVTHALFGSLWPTWAIDRLYSLWIIPVGSLPMLAAVLARSRRQWVQVVLAWVLGWIVIASVGAWIGGSAGPCFYPQLIAPDANFALLGRRLAALSEAAAASGTTINAVAYQQMLLDGYRAKTLIAAGGISATPSMHVAFATLLVLAARVMLPRLYRAAIVYLAVIWVGSIHLGWHYAVDGPIAVLAMLAVWRLSGRLARAICPDAGDAGGALQSLGDKAQGPTMSKAEVAVRLVRRRAWK